jgi:hypothetical protein
MDVGCQYPECTNSATVRAEFEHLPDAKRIIGFDDRRPQINVAYYCQRHFHAWLEDILEPVRRAHAL